MSKAVVETVTNWVTNEEKKHDTNFETSNLQSFLNSPPTVVKLSFVSFLSLRDPLKLRN
jgi:hypothetical protein